MKPDPRGEEKEVGEDIVVGEDIKLDIRRKCKIWKLNNW
jgi:hypothetical protein